MYTVVDQEVRSQSDPCAWGTHPAHVCNAIGTSCSAPAESMCPVHRSVRGRGCEDSAKQGEAGARVTATAGWGPLGTGKAGPRGQARRGGARRGLLLQREGRRQRQRESVAQEGGELLGLELFCFRVSELFGGL